MSIQDELIKTIELMIDKKISDRMNLDVQSTVIDVKDGKYQIMLDGATYWVYDAVGCSPTVGSAVWVHTPNNRNNMTQAFIIGLRGGANG